VRPHASPLRLVALATLATTCVACRFGGPTASPDEYVAFPDAASDAADIEPSDDAGTADAEPFADADATDSAPTVDAAPSVDDAPSMDAESTSDAPGQGGAPTDASSTEGSMPVEAAVDGA
jgi:hypothetical protein